MKWVIGVAAAVLLTPSVASADTTVSVATWNIKITHTSDADARSAIDFLLSLSPQPQIIVMNEARNSEMSVYINEAETRTGVTWQGVIGLQCPTGAWNGTTCTGTEDEGEVILTSLPMTSSSTTWFPGQDCWHSARGAARAAVTVGSTTLQVFTTHLQTGGCANDEQLRLDSVANLKSWASGYSSPQLVAGDFNATPASTEIASTTVGMAQVFTDAWPVAGSGSGYTYPALDMNGNPSTPTDRIDYWFSKGTATVTSISVPSSTFSDHDPVRATFSLTSGGGGSSPNLLSESGFEGYTPPALGTPGWVSDTGRGTPAKSDTSAPHSGTNNGICATTTLDCGIFQDITAPATGKYRLTIYANASRTGGLVGVDIPAGTSKTSAPVAVRSGGYGDPYTLTFDAIQGDQIHVWMYSPNTPGNVVIDDATLFGPNLLTKAGFEEYTPPSLGAPGWVSDRTTTAVSDTSMPHTGTKDAICNTTSSDCGMYQDVTAQATGTYTISFFANANHSGGLVGVDVGTSTTSTSVAIRSSYGDPYTMTFSATAGQTIHVWMYAPNTAGFVAIDDVWLVGPN